jgi:cationic amino acid transporter 3
MRHFFDFLYRKKNFEKAKTEKSKLKRSLNVFELTALGTGCTIVSVYMLIGIVVSQITGPSAVLAFIAASCITSLSALAYAELAARVPRSGSAYTYIYVTIGEFLAFIIGWDMLLEYMIGNASVATSLSQYIDTLSGNKISSYLKAHLSMHVKNIAQYPDFLAFGLTMVVIG